MHSDYIVVGAGSAGCVLANRLSADPSNRVILIEAGQHDWNPLIRRPFGVVALIPGTMHNWAYAGEAEPHLGGRSLYHPRGKVLGGSSAINGMIYIRGNARDYDMWRQMGNTGWSHADVLPYFRRLENFTAGEDAFHGSDGPMRIDAPPAMNALHHAWIAAGRELGHPVTDDFNGARQEGFGIYHHTLSRGRRWSAAHGYLKPVRDRPNLKVVTTGHVTRVRFEGKRAVGVDCLQGGKLQTVRAEREVIVCGGAFNSPQILQLSGIGPTDTLRALGIEVVQSLPGVGANLQDHPDVSLAYGCSQPITLNSRTAFPRVIGEAVRAMVTRGGVLNEFPVRSGAFLKSDPACDVPDLQFHFAHGAFLDHGRTRIDTDAFGVRVGILRPESRGSVSLRSADPLAPPRIVTNFLATEADMRGMRASVRMAQEIIAARAFDALRTHAIRPEKRLTDTAEIDAFLRERTDSVYHPVGTCRMGQDANAVVDSELRVHGVDALRVVDASIMPTLIGGNTNAPTIMIAEKAADMILGRVPPEAAELSINENTV